MSRPQVPALCCLCGTVRQTTDYGGRGEDNLDHLDQLNAMMRDARNRLQPRRCTVSRKCATCGRTTTHAYLRADADADQAEREDRIRTMPLQLEIWELLTELRTRPNVRLREAAPSQLRHGIGVTRYLYEDTWTVTIYGTPPPRYLLDRLHDVQGRIVDEPRTPHSWYCRAENGLHKPSVNIMWANTLDEIDGWTS